ncbi:TauD/TfdA family dioxygenase [Metabacillus sp. cB07]|uniref:TauD/TfdA family dioxygenase n=1 Tax=Metabacillus sp. cB07 TaxID=2806989 RepID=UPI00193A0ADA|nr:TauD/TfdA family dioxygenase [Metabacillus sp. cB07]
MIDSSLINNKILTVGYHENCCVPVDIDSSNNLTQEQATKIISNYNTFGFSIFQFYQPIKQDLDLINFYRSLGLYKPFVPGIYQKTPGIYEKSGLNHISKKYSDMNAENLHRAFQTTNNQELHSDGTLEGIGRVKTSTLFCVNPAGEGGDNLIFNSVAAFISLWKMSPEIAFSMLDENALRRWDIGRTNRSSTGPTFKFTDNTIISRFSLDNTCDWEYGFNKVKNLKECFDQLLSFIKPGPYYISVKLLENQGLIIANHKISHGRTSYFDTADSPRKMIRGLYTVEPRLI